MKIVSYGQGNWYVLTDKQFEASMSFWANGGSAYVDKLGVLLPPPRKPSGTPPEHSGLEIGYSWGAEAPIWGLPGFVAVRKPTVSPEGNEIQRAAVFFRDSDLSDEEGSFRWREVNVRNHGDASVPDDLTSAEVKEFVGKLNFRKIDDVLENDNLRDSVQLGMLIPKSML